jgi:hypothetical protein
MSGESKTVAILIVAVAAGFAAGRIIEPRPSGKSTQRQASSPQDAESGQSKIGLESQPADWDLIQALPETSTDQLPALLKEVMAMENQQKHFAFGALISRWIELDVDGARDAARNAMDGGYMLTHFYEEWGAIDRDAAIAKVQGLTDANERKLYMGSILNSVARADPDAFFELLEKHPGSQGTESGVDDIFRKLAASNVEDALMKAQPLDQRMRMRAHMGIAQAWASDSPEKALDWAKSLEVAHGRDYITATVFRVAAGTDPTFVLENLDLTSESYQQELLQRVVDSIDISDPRFAWDMLKPNLEGQMAGFGLSRLIAKLTPQQGRELIDSETLPDEVRKWVVDSHLSSLRTPDQFVDAAEWANALPNADSQSAAVGSLFQKMLEAMSTDDLSLLVGRLPGEIAERVSKRVEGERLIAAGDIDQFGEWFWEQEAAAQNSWGYTYIPWALETDPADAASAIAAAVPEEGALVPGARGLAKGWTKFAPQEAANWAATIGDEATRIAAFGTIADEWASNDALAASQWISSLQSGGEKDAAVEVLVKEIVRDVPDAAFRWAATITDPDKKSEAIKNSIEQWARSDPNAALQAVETSQFSDDERANLAEIIEARRSKK